MAIAHQSFVLELELELTVRCPRACGRCFNRPDPSAGRGTMMPADWRRVIDHAALLGFDDTLIQFVGGDLSVFPNLAELEEYALVLGHRVETVWDSAERCTGLVGMLDEQRLAEAHAGLEDLGVQPILVDRMFGRATEQHGVSGSMQPCGRCREVDASISRNGDVHLCGLSRLFGPVGNVRQQPLPEILDSSQWQRLTALLPGPDITTCTTTCTHASVWRWC